MYRVPNWKGRRAQVTVARVRFCHGAARRTAGASGAERAEAIIGSCWRSRTWKRHRRGVQQAQSGLQTAAGTARSRSLAVADQEIQAARAGVEQAQAGVAGALGRKQARVWSARSTAWRSNLTARAGETAQPGTPLVSVIDPSAGCTSKPWFLRVRSACVRVGQAANVRADTTASKKCICPRQRSIAGRGAGRKGISAFSPASTDCFRSSARRAKREDQAWGRQALLCG